MTIEQLNYLLRKELYAIMYQIGINGNAAKPNSTRCWETGGLLK